MKVIIISLALLVPIVMCCSSIHANNEYAHQKTTTQIGEVVLSETLPEHNDSSMVESITIRQHTQPGYDPSVLYTEWMKQNTTEGKSGKKRYPEWYGGCFQENGLLVFQCTDVGKAYLLPEGTEYRVCNYSYNQLDSITDIIEKNIMAADSLCISNVIGFGIQNKYNKILVLMRDTSEREIGIFKNNVYPEEEYLIFKNISDLINSDSTNDSIDTAAIEYAAHESVPNSESNGNYPLETDSIRDIYLYYQSHPDTTPKDLVEEYSRVFREWEKQHGKFTPGWVEYPSWYGGFYIDNGKMIFQLTSEEGIDTLPEGALWKKCKYSHNELEAISYEVWNRMDSKLNNFTPLELYIDERINRVVVIIRNNRAEVLKSFKDNVYDGDALFIP